MTRAGVGQATDGCGVLAAKRATADAMERGGITRADCVLLFASADYSCQYTRLLDAVHDLTGADNIVGCSAAGVLSSEGEIEGSPGIAVLAATSDNLHFQSFLSHCSDDQPVRTALGSRRDVSCDESSLLMLFSDVFNVEPSYLLREIQSRIPYIPVVGAGASGRLDSTETFQWHWEEGCESLNHCISRSGVAGLLMCGDFDALIDVAQGCEPIGEPYIITRAEGHVVLEIANRPAMDILYEATATLTDRKSPLVFDSLFAGIAADEEKYPVERGDYLIRNIAGVQPETGALVITEEVRVGQTIQFHLKNRRYAHEDMERSLHDLSSRAAGRSLAMGFYFNCLGRGQGLYGEPNHDIQLIREAFPGLPIVGFFGNAEFAPANGRSLSHNCTGVLALIADRDDAEVSPSAGSAPILH